MKWISVKDKVPEDNVFVLVYVPNYPGLSNVHICCAIHRKKRNIWHSIPGIDDIEPTHWMPLPEMPEEK